MTLQNKSDLTDMFKCLSVSKQFQPSEVSATVETCAIMVPQSPTNCVSTTLQPDSVQVETQTSLQSDFSTNTAASVSIEIQSELFFHEVNLILTENVSDFKQGYN